ncbi:carbohydrate kinase family protein [Kineosporia sp. A_224]|uniref:carbohydrate kinase family protein n=1 Tax=Kineosporia sp. A_224 TaxID=1962180 RepID=UPI000B4A5B70|nr:carbohydrate kinase family protein [Kineosporia sp. A_224]
MTPSWQERAGVLCAGCIVVDAAKVVDVWPTPERLAMIESVNLSTGGPGLNMAVDLARLGAPFPVGLAGVVGDDDHGRFVLDECAAVGVGTGGVRVTADAATSFTDAMVLKGSGVRTFFHHAGANDLLVPDDVPLGASSARVFHCGSPGIHAAMDTVDAAGDTGWVRLLRAAQTAGLRTNLELVGLDALRLRDLARPCLPHLDYLVVNEVEASATAGVEVKAVGVDGAVDWAGIEAAARGCLDLGVGRLVVVHCPAGAVAVAKDGTVHRHGSVRLPPEVIRNATGAGDAFAAGVVLGLHEDLPVEDCLRLGVCAAAANLQGAGTSDGVVPAADCLALGTRYGYRDVT